MGFFSSLIKTVTGIGRAVLGIPAAAAPVARRVAGAVVRQAPGILGGVAAGAAFAGGQALLAPGAAGQVGVTAGQGLVRQTIVQTFDRMTGQVVRTEVLKGAPFLMRREVTALKRVVRLVRQANARIPKITREKSKLAQLKDRLVSDALSRGACPTG